MIDSHGGTRTLAGQSGAEVFLEGFSVCVETGPDAGQVRHCQGSTLTIGSAPTNELVLSDPLVSRQHALLRLTPRGIQLEDQGSKNGTWVGGLRVETAYILDGATVVLGSTLLRVTRTREPLRVDTSPETTFHSMVSQSEAMRSIFSLIRRLAPHDLPVAVDGETGTGKELVARALHENSTRREKPFLILDCGSVVRELLAAQLFGHEKGAFSGADQDRPGIFESADGGTVFLDEIGELDISIQPHLLRVLETRQICRIGSHQHVSVNFRLVSATNRNLRERTAEGKFREDLLYRMSAVSITLPSLRERHEDIPLLARHFLQATAERNGIPAPMLLPDAIPLLVGHGWPGNVRELKQTMEALSVLSGEGPISAALVGQALGSGRGRSGSRPPVVPSEAPAAPLVPAPVADGTPPVAALDLASAEKRAILEALRATGWKRTLAAQKLGIARSTLWQKMRQHGIPPDPPPA
jgi:DNA-binding NtrC family response regulator